MANTSTTENKQDLVILGSSFPRPIAASLNTSITQMGYKTIHTSIGGFKSGERFCELYNDQQNMFAEKAAEMTGANIHVVMNIGTNMNNTIIDTINIVETAKEYGAKNIHVILAFAPYARQDRPFDKRFVSMMAKTLPKHLKAAGADRLSTFDVHSKSAEKFYDQYFGENNVHFISAVDDIQHTVQRITTANDTIKYGAPDGADKPDDVAQRKARQITRMAYGANCVLDTHMFGIEKTHTGVNNTKVTNFIGNVQNCVAVEIDDMTDTGGTLVNGARVLKENGAKHVIAAVTHGIFSGKSLSVLTADIPENPIDILMTTDSVLNIYKKAGRLTAAQKKRLVILPTAPLISRALEMKFD